jgi:DNA polymerase-3 subunit delta'
VTSFRTVGQPAALAAVRRAVETGRPPHALLLVGPDSVGKTTLAFDLACGLLCLAPQPASRPCRECPSCRKVDNGNHPDLHLVSPEGAGQQIRIGQIQALASEMALLPLEGRFRIALIENAHRLNVDAQNALLKTLEEPPAAVVLVLAASDSAALLPTVASRCVRLRLGPVDTETIGALLAGMGLADASRGTTLGRLAGGRPGVALRLAADAEAVLVYSRIARTLLDLTAADRRRRLSSQAELLEDGARLAAASSGLAADGAEDGERATPGKSGRRVSPAERRAAVAQILAVWRDVARDLAVAAQGGRRELRLHDLLDELVQAAAGMEVAQAARFLDRVEGMSRAVDAYANPELVLDTLLVQWPQRRQAA